MGIFRGLVEDLIRNISGGLGRRLRAAYYKKRFQKCGKGLVIETNVHFYSCQMIEVGDHVWIDKNSVLIAGMVNHDQHTKFIENKDFKGSPGHILIGSYAHIGLNAVLQGHGGIVIGDHFTSSANCSVYSLSNDMNKCRFGTVANDNGPVFYISSPVQINNNVWLGLGVKVIGKTIDDDCFILPNAVVTKSVPKNSVAGGFPAERIRNRFKDDTKKE